MTRPYEPDSSLREQLAQADHVRHKTFSSDPNTFRSWENLDPHDRANWLARQDWVLAVLPGWLEARADEVDAYASACMNPVARDTYRQQAQGLRNTAWALRKPTPVTDLAPEVARLKKELELAEDVLLAAGRLTASGVTIRSDQIDLIQDLDEAVARYRKAKS